jgi:hypothetical protein
VHKSLNACDFFAAIMGAPQVYAVEKGGKTQYFFAGGSYKQTMPLTWEALAERINQYVNNYHNPSIIMRLPKADLEKLVWHEQRTGAKAALRTLENGTLELTRNGSVSTYRELDGNEVSRLSPPAQRALYLSDGRTPALSRTEQHL